MSSNIKHEAVYPPALYSLRRMAHQSPTINTSKGSFELYDSQQTAVGSLGEKVIGLGAPTPGGLVQNYKQVVMNLQRELDESNRNGSELQQIIAGMNSSQTASTGVDSSFIEGSLSNDILGENVKDAHIKHLQRQVTILQANLYKCEGWVNRVATATKERDKAIDDVARLTNEMKNLEGDNQQLLQRIETLETALQESQQNLRQVSEDLQAQMYNGRLVSHLRDEIQRQNCEIATLKESLTRLDSENRSLKDSSVDMSSQSVGSMSCSQELEHLHLVVDKLKSTVLDQRSYLLQLKKPNGLRNTKSVSMTSSTMSNSLLNQDVIPERKMSSPSVRTAAAGSVANDVAVGILPQQAGFGQCNQTVGLSSAALKEGLLDSKKPLHRNISSSDLDHELATGTRRKLSSRDILDDVFAIEDVNLPHSGQTQGDGFKPNPGLHMEGSTYPADIKQHKSPEICRQHGSGDMTEKNAGQAGLTSSAGYVLAKSPQHRTSQSEVIAHRDRSEKAGPENWGSKSEILGRNATWQWNMTSSNKSPILSSKVRGVEVDKFVQVSPGLALNHGHRYLSAKAGQLEAEEPSHKGNPSESHRQPALNGSTRQMVLDGSRNSPTFQLHQMYPQMSGSCHQGLTHDMLAPGAQLAAPLPHAHCATLSHGPGHEVLYVNTADQGLIAPTAVTSSSVDPDPSRARLNSDRLCPVCNNDFSRVSMEDFQTHVFECFDNENPPETIKPCTSPDRLCPMCNTQFGPETTQSQYEKHVHSHFGEDCVGENLEFVQL